VQSRQLIEPTKWKNSQETIQGFKTTISINPEAGLVFDAPTVQTNERTNKQKSPNSFQNKNHPTKEETKNENQRRKTRRQE
jgi:hypothetical protein